MRFIAVIGTALSAASVLAAPLEKRAYFTTWTIQTITETSTVYGAPPAATPSAIGGLQQGGGGGVSSPPVPTTTSAPPPPPTTTAVVVPPPAPTTNAQPAPSPSSNPVAGACAAYNPNPDFNTPLVSCGVSILDTINKWRVAYGKPQLAWASNLAEAAWTTLTQNGGGPKMEHLLSHGSYGEIISPGYWNTATLDDPSATEGESPFEVALMGWLCEVKSDPQLQASGFTGKNQCGIVAQTTFISGSANPNEPTGHHDIFISDTYKTVACGYMQSQTAGQPSQWAGQWVCEFGF